MIKYEYYVDNYIVTVQEFETKWISTVQNRVHRGMVGQREGATAQEALGNAIHDLFNIVISKYDSDTNTFSYTRSVQ